MYVGHRSSGDGHSAETKKLFLAAIWYIKINKLKLFSSQQDKPYFGIESLKSFHSNYECSKRRMNNVESFRIVRSYN